LSFDRGAAFGENQVMQILFRSQKLKADSFTLVELLVVISIIGLLAGLSIPAIQNGLKKANQTQDVSNIRQCGTMLFMRASDYEGNFDAGLTNPSSSDVFDSLIESGLLTTPKILAGKGYTAATSTNNVQANNIAWGYVDGLNTADDGQLVLLASKGTPTLLPVTSLNKDGLGWKDDGIVIYRVHNSAEYVKAGTKGAPQGSVNLQLPDGTSQTVSQN